MQRVDHLTIGGLGLLLMPLLTMWHEIGGHAAVCALQGGQVKAIGAFYVACDGLSGAADIRVAGAGVFVNIVLALGAYVVWRRAVAGNASDLARITLWLVWVSEAFVASGYFLFSGVSGFGDLGIGKGGALSGLGLTGSARILEIAVGLASYILLVRSANRTLSGMIGTGPESRRARRVIAHGYYVSVGIAAVLVGILNPLGIAITVMSAAASSFGGLAGFISVGFGAGKEGEAKPILIGRSLAIVGAGVAASVAFALVFGPSLQLGG